MKEILKSNPYVNDITDKVGIGFNFCPSLHQWKPRKKGQIFNENLKLWCFLGRVLWEKENTQHDES